MRQNSSLPNHCETAAIRVQYWFGRDKDNLLHLSSGEPKSHDFCKKYKCDQLKPPRIISHVEHLPLQGYALSKSKKQIKTRQVTAGNPLKRLQINVDASCCSVNQKSFLHLSPSRVAHSKFREHFLVSKRLKNIRQQSSGGPKRHQMVPINSSVSKASEETPYHQEFKEERHFNIGRVIKYLMD
jgi:hypothetical protein